MQEFFEKNLKENEKREKITSALGRNEIKGCAIFTSREGIKLLISRKNLQRFMQRVTMQQGRILQFTALRTRMLRQNEPADF